MKLIIKAFDTHQIEVLHTNKIYQRYADDFVNSHLYHDAVDAWSKNEHNKNIGILKTLLYERYELILQFFNTSKLSEVDVENIIHLLNSTESPYVVSPFKSELQPISTIEPPPITPNFECSFDTSSLHLIVRCVNDLQIFRELVSFEDMSSLFACKPLRKLTATKNGFVAVFFKGLCRRNLIVSTWQNVISFHELIYSSNRKGFLNQKRLSNGLYQYEMGQWSSKDDLLNKYLDKLCKL